MALALAALAPPAEGRLLLIPLDGDEGVAVRAAVAGGGALAGEGPWPGSMVVVGTRALLAPRLLAARVLMLAAPPGGCGAGQPGARA